MLERTLVLLKPDCVQRGLIGEVLRRFEAKGLQVVGLKLRQFSRALQRIRGLACEPRSSALCLRRG